MLGKLSAGASNGIAFLVSAGIVFEIIACMCSSPQTAELNAEKRAPTLMKWVHVGQVTSGGFVVIAAAMDKKHSAAIITGGVAAMGLMEFMYLHAKAAGLANGGPATEDW